MEITETKLKENYTRYVETCREDGEQPRAYDDWKQWFITTFGVTVIE